MVIEFTVPGQPQGKARPRFSTQNGIMRTFTDNKTILYEKLVRTEYQRQCGDVRFADDVALSVNILAQFDIPVSTSKKKRHEILHGRGCYTKKVDADNIAKAILDSLNGIAYRDDKQVSDLTVQKRYGEKPMVSVEIKAVEM